MKDFKMKKQMMEAKNSDLLNKQRKKLKKKSKRTRKKENLKYQTDVTQGLGRLRAKGNQGVEGMFFKGLRSEYVTRDHLNEGNEARKNEDINRIIDLGRVFLQKKQRLRRPPKRNFACKDNRKLAISPGCKRAISNNGNENLNQYLLSPIRFAFTLKENYNQDSKSRAIKSRKLDLDKEFASFVSKYEERVGAHVLIKLPEIGVLEDAVEVLRKIHKPEPTDSKKAIENDNFEANDSKKKFSFLTQNLEPEMLMEENFIDNVAFPEECLVPKKRLYNYEDFMEKPLENSFIMTDVESVDYNSAFMPIFDNGERSENLKFHGFLKKEFEKPDKDWSITSPPIHFYRRNMF